MKRSLIFTARHVIMTVFAVACATTQTEGESKSQKVEVKAEEPKKDEAKTQFVQGREQENVKSWVAKRSEKEAEVFCLFSSGGWTNRGQHCVYVSGKTKILYSKSFQGKEFTEKKLSDAKSKALLDFGKKMAQLKSIHKQAFDHLKFEYVAFTKKGLEVTSGTRVLIDHPEPDTVDKKYMDLIDSYLKNVEKINPK